MPAIDSQVLFAVDLNCTVDCFDLDYTVDLVAWEMLLNVGWNLAMLVVFRSIEKGPRKRAPQSSKYVAISLLALFVACRTGRIAGHTRSS